MMNLKSLPQFTRDAKRFREIVGIFVKYGLADWIPEREPEFMKEFFKSSGGVRLSELDHNVRVRMVLTELGPTFIKLGQIMSTRPDLVGPGLAEELAELQSSTPPDPPEFVREAVEAELGKPIEELFAEFDLQAMASASIGQIHKATLPDGQAVVVKVQHHGIGDTIETDLDILMALADLAEKNDPNLRYFQPRATVAEFRRNLLRELDFLREVRNLQQFIRNFEDNPAIHIPMPYPNLSSRRVLTMERLVGVSVGKRERLLEEGIDLHVFTQRFSQMFVDMIFRDGFYHADPHPGNIWALAGNRVGLLDFGMVGRLDSRTREQTEDLLLALLQNDAEQLTDTVLRLGSVPQSLDRGLLQTDIEEFVAEHFGEGDLKDFDMSGTLNDLTAIVRNYHILLPSSISSLIKVLIMLEGTAQGLDSNFQLLELLKPYQAQAMQRRLSPERLLHRLQRSYRDWERLLDMLPRELAEILKGIQQGEFDVHLDVRRFDPIVNRLVYGILIAALFTGSCRVLSQEIPPLIGGFSAFGAGGCLLAMILSYRLLRAINRSGDLGQK